MTTYATYDRIVVGNNEGYRISSRSSDNLSARSEVVKIQGGLDAAHAYLADHSMTYVKNMKEAARFENENAIAAWLEAEQIVLWLDAEANGQLSFADVA